MKKTCPKKIRTQCVWWEIVSISLLVFLAVYSILVHVPGYNLTHELILSTGATFSVLWCLWVVRTFRNMMTWWSDLQTNIETAAKLLEETKQDIKEIKSINHELSSR